jgi:allantoate deiminase
MRLRRDALAGAAEWVSAVEAIALETQGLIATVGKIDVEPNAANVIAGVARLSLDVRHADDAARKAAVESLVAQAQSIAEKRGSPSKSRARWISPRCPWTSA